MTPNLNITSLRSALCAASIFGVCLAAPFAQAASMVKADYVAGKDRIKATEKADLDACKASTANAKDICVAQAKAKDKIARAELEFAYSGKPRDEAKVAEVRKDASDDKRDADYKVAAERCDAMTGATKDACVAQAKARFGKT